MKIQGANETDVREEIAAPLLFLLGYERGTANDILREASLSYDRIFLGRKKANDPPLRGRADYVLSVTGAGRWVLEAKAPTEEITKDVVDQAISYARHPEIAASYAAVLNGKRFVLFHSTARSTDAPIVDLPVTSAAELANQLRGVLSPPAIRRDCSPPVVDLSTPLAEGFRSTAEITRGTFTYSTVVWESNVPLPPQQRAHFDETCRRMRMMRTTVVGGRVWRDGASRIIAKLDWTAPNDELLKFAQDKKLLDIEYVSLSSTVSGDPAQPTVFDVAGGITVQQGETMFDILRWDTFMAGIAMAMNYRGQAAGIMKDGTFLGDFQAEYEASFPIAPAIRLSFLILGNFEISLDGR